ncbi:hypothetical protein KA005_34805, partial [bacterium]|nr:hypothetical protein [bacterium]
CPARNSKLASFGAGNQITTGARNRGGASPDVSSYSESRHKQAVKLKWRYLFESSTYRASAGEDGIVCMKNHVESNQ